MSRKQEEALRQADIAEAAYKKENPDVPLATAEVLKAVLELPIGEGTGIVSGEHEEKKKRKSIRQKRVNIHPGMIGASERLHNEDHREDRHDDADNGDVSGHNSLSPVSSMFRFLFCSSIVLSYHRFACLFCRCHQTFLPLPAPPVLRGKLRTTNRGSSR
jgi:hypothetical protein